MSANRMNNRCVTPPGVPFSNRPVERPERRLRPDTCNPCGPVCNPDEAVDAACPGSGTSGVVGGIVVQGRTDDCDKEYELQGLPIAMAYVPWQTYANIYPVSQALRQGTMFAELDLDFLGRRCN